MVRNLMIILGLSLSLAAFGCSSDDDGGNGNGGGSGGDGGVTDACLGASDTAAVCDDGFNDLLFACGEEATGVGSVVATCLQEDPPALTEDCAGCYGADIDCLVANCVVNMACFPDNTDQACADCREEFCNPALNRCTGAIDCGAGGNGGNGGNGGAGGSGGSGGGGGGG